MKRSHLTIGVLVVIIGAVFLLNSMYYIIDIDSEVIIALTVILLGVVIILNPSIVRDLGNAFRKEATDSREREKKGAGGFFAFRYMISTQLIKLIYALGMIALIVAGLVFMGRGNDEYQLMGLGIILWGIFCGE